MKLKSTNLIRNRGGHSRGPYSCPIHIPIESCQALFNEAGIEPAPKAVGALGDILENFAISIFKNYDGKTMSEEQLGITLRNVLGE